MPTTRIEGFLFAISITMAGLFVKLIKSKEGDLLITFILGIIILLAGLFRISWSLLFISLIGLLFRNHSWKKLLMIFLLSVLPISLLIIYHMYFSSPYPFISYKIIHSVSEGNFSQLFPLIKNTFTNLTSFFSTKDTPIYVLLRYQMLWVLIVSVVDYVNSIRNFSSRGKEQSKNLNYLNASNIGSIFMFGIIFHAIYAGKEYRLWAPHILLTLMILLFSSRKKLVVGIVISNLIFLVSFGNTFYKERYSNFLRDNSDIVEIQSAITEYITTDPVGSHWCSTIDVSRYSSEVTWGPWMLTLPEEFGVTSIINWKNFYHTKINAKYVLLEPEYINENYPYLFRNTNLEPLTETPIGILYYNWDSQCPSVD
jgi:hypothetical protein